MDSIQSYDEAIIAMNPNVFIIFKPLYILYSILGINSFTFDGKKITPVGKFRKVSCILVCGCIIFAGPNYNEFLRSDKFSKDRLKYFLDFLINLLVQSSACIALMMPSFVSGENTVKMIKNFYKIENHLKVIQICKPSGAVSLKILILHIFTLLLIFAYTTVCVTTLNQSIFDLWPIFNLLLNSMVIKKFATEIYVIMLYVDKITIEIEEFSKRRTEKSKEAVNMLPSDKISKQTNTLMQLYNKLSENSCISNSVIHFPVITYPFK